MTAEEKLDNLIRHIEKVREACQLLGKRLISSGREHFGRMLIARGFVHDCSKFYGMEWEYLDGGPEVPVQRKQMAIEHHRLTNPHHPEYWGSIEQMPELAVAEMICDWYARSQEFGTNLREWICEEAVPKYQIDIQGERFVWIESFVNLLLNKPFD